MISDFLEFDNSTSIVDLQAKTGYSNRRIRELIEQERQVQKDFVIISSSHSKGYFKTRDKEKIKGYLAEQNHRAVKILYNLKSAKKFLGEVDQFKIIWENEKPKFKLEDCQEKIAIHCTSLEQLIIVNEVLKAWKKKEYIENVVRKYGSNLVIYIRDKEFDGFNKYEDKDEEEGFTFFEFDNFTWEA